CCECGRRHQPGPWGRWTDDYHNAAGEHAGGGRVDRRLILSDAPLGPRLNRDSSPMNLNLTTATRIGLNLLALLGVAVSLYLGASVFIPLTISVLVASVLFPAARFLHDRLYFPWFFACLTVLLATVALFLVVFIAFAIAIPRTIEGFPKTEDEWKEQY